jgi:hypothetical protein
LTGFRRGSALQIIETERLILRPFREGDAAALFSYLRAPIATCLLSLKPADLAEAETEVKKTRPRRGPRGDMPEAGRSGHRRRYRTIEGNQRRMAEGVSGEPDI